MNTYFLYIIRCADDTLYTGITTDVERRFAQHVAGTASKYTRAHKATVVVYTEKCGTRSDALKREAAVKKLSRAAKEQLIESATM